MPALTGPEKAVLMLLSLDEATAAPIVAELDDMDLRKLREVASMMRAVPADALTEVYGEFIERARGAVAVPRGGVGYLRRLAAKAHGEARSQEIFQGVKQSGLERIATVDPTAVASLMEKEHPQLVAAILSQLDPLRAAKIVEALPEDRQSLIIARLAGMTEVPAGLLEGVAVALAEDLPPAQAEASMSVDGVNAAAGILRKLGKTNSSAVISRLEEEGNEITESLKRALHTFEDLSGLDPRSLRLLLKEVPQDRLVLALKTASDAMRQVIFSSMSSRAAELLRDDLDSLGSVRLGDVDAAQREIVEIALRLEAEGTISLGGEDDLV